MANINQRLNGLNPLAYIGDNAFQPTDFITQPRDPNESDSKNFYLGTWWLNTESLTIWYLANLNGTIATWIMLSAGSTGLFLSVTGDTGGPVFPDIDGNLDMPGSHGINTAGTTNTLTIAINNDIELGDLAPIAFGAPALRAVTGNVQIDSGNLTLPATTDEDVGVLQIAGNSFLHAYGVDNTFAGSNAGNFTLTTASSRFNVGVGTSSLGSLTTGASNTATGYDSLGTCTDSVLNSAYGINSLIQVTTGSGGNSAFGANSLNQLDSGANNVAIGLLAGSNYATNESNNIVIGAQTQGVLGESNTLRVGNGTGTGAGNLNRAFVSGIEGVDLSTSTVVTVNSDQLGSTTITGGTGITITPGAGTLTISGNPGGIPVAFLATNTTNATNVAGGGTPYFAILDDVIFDTASAYNPSTGIYTCPYTGIYAFFSSLNVNNVLSGNNAGEIGALGGSLGMGINLFNASQLSGPFINSLNLINTTVLFFTAGTQVRTQVTCFGPSTLGVGGPAGASNFGGYLIQGQSVPPASVASFGATTPPVGSGPTNVTGDGTAYTIVFSNILYNTGGGYNASTGIFTAPNTGYYQFSSTIVVNNIAAGHTAGTLALVGTFGTVYGQQLNLANSAQLSGTYTNGVGMVVFNTVFMNSGDTAGVQVVGYGSTLTLGIQGFGVSNFSGSQIF